MSLLRSYRPIALLGLGLLMLDPSQVCGIGSCTQHAAARLMVVIVMLQAFQLGLKDRQPGALRSIGTRRRLGLTRMQAAGEDDWESKQGEEARRKRVMQMQREITEDILAVSEEEREARKQKVLRALSLWHWGFPSAELSVNYSQYTQSHRHASPLSMNSVIERKVGSQESHLPGLCERGGPAEPLHQPDRPAQGASH